MFYLVLLAWAVFVITGWAGFAFKVLHNRKPNELGIPIWLFPLAAVTLIAPTIIFLATTIFLLLAHPTVQFNGGDDYRIGLWSWWLLWYPTIVFSSKSVMILDAIILLSATFIHSMRKIFYIVAASLLGSGIGLFVLAHASPSA